MKLEKAAFYYFIERMLIMKNHFFKKTSVLCLISSLSLLMLSSTAAAAANTDKASKAARKKVPGASITEVETDIAAAIILASGEAVEKYGLKPMAKLIGWGQGGVDPKIMGVGPVPASRAAMKKAGSWPSPPGETSPKAARRPPRALPRCAARLPPRGWTPPSLTPPAAAPPRPRENLLP